MTAPPETCESRLALNVSCSNLPRLNAAELPCPFAVIYIDSRISPGFSPPTPNIAGNGTPVQQLLAGAHRNFPWEKVGQTEAVVNTVDPKWAVSFGIPYFFERAQRLAVDVFFRGKQHDGPLTRHTYVGSAECLVSRLVRARNQIFQMPLKNETSLNASSGEVTIIVEDTSESKQKNNMVSLDVTLSYRSGRNRGEPSKLNILRCNQGSREKPLSTEQAPSEQWIVVNGPTDVKSREGDSFTFENITAGFQRLCLSDEGTMLRFEVVDSGMAVVGAGTSTFREWKDTGRVKLFSGSTTSLETKKSMFSRNGNGHSGKPNPLSSLMKYRLKSSPRRVSSDDAEVGQLKLTNIEEFTEHGFLDYVGSGYEISLLIAIDFTASNGDASQVGTLHYRDPFGSNEYESAIKSVGEILVQYDTDNLVPAFGFGAKVCGSMAVSHCFSLTGNDDATCAGLRGVLAAYRETLMRVTFSGPTEFSKILESAIAHVREHNTRRQYSILLIITDGVINDVDETMEKIAEASCLPLSIVIIGVGEADFTEMNLLDGDTVRIPGAERDIVQFVPFRKYRGAPEVLASKVLEEIPDQFIQYMRKHRIEPEQET